MEPATIAAICTVLATIIGIGSYQYYKLPQDNIVEEVCEEVIKKETGADIDLSPESKENDK